MREIRTEAVVDAPPSAVWAVLTDLEAYEEWNPHVVAARGELREGGTVELTVRPGAGRERSMRARVTAVDPERRLEWVGTAGSRLLFRGRHTFELEPAGENRTRLVNRERLSGALVPFVVRSGVETDYEGMNRALAGRATGAVDAPTEVA